MLLFRLAARSRAWSRYLSTREPPMGAVTSRAELLMQSAIKDGQLDNLAGAGKPLPVREESSPRVGISTAQMLSQRAENEMRRAARAGELDGLPGHGEALRFRGTGEAATRGHIAQYVKANTAATADNLRD